MSADDIVMSAEASTSDYVAVVVAGHLFGLPIERVRQVFRLGEMTPVPLAPAGVSGLVNLRGRVAVAVDLRARLGLDAGGPRSMAAGLEFQGDAYALVIDEIGDVLRLRDDAIEAAHTHLPLSWRGMSEGVYRLADRLMVALNVDAVLDLGRPPCLAAA